MDPVRFEELVSVRKRPVLDESLMKPTRFLEDLFRASTAMDRYVGFYYRYFFSFGHKGRIIKSLGLIHADNGRYYWKNIERLRVDDSDARVTINKYVGAAFLLADRIFIVEYEALQRNSITQVTLYPCYRSHVDRLLGIQTGGPVRRGRKPGASKVLFDYIGRDVNVRNALRQTGLFDCDDPQISPDIRSMITNRIEDGSYILEAEEP